MAAMNKLRRSHDEHTALELNSPYSATQLHPYPSQSDLDLDKGDSYSIVNSSRTHLRSSCHTPTMYPPGTTPSPPTGAPSPDIPTMPTPLRHAPSRGDPVDQAERAGIPGLPYTGAERPTHISHNSSWDILSGIKKFEQSYQEFDSRHASEAHLVFADGDVPNNKVRSSTFIIEPHLSAD